MVSTVIDVVKALASVVGWAEQFDKGRRAKLAALFEAISAVLEDFRLKRQQGQRTPGLCAELKEYANALRDVASGTLPSPEIDRLASELAGACDVLQKLSPAGERQPDQKSYDEYLDQLADGAGAFRGCAKVLRGE